MQSESSILQTTSIAASLNGLLNFMKGAGHIDGEIMETLWSGMNKVSGAARSMSKAHRQETLDDYMRDANWKKTVGIGKFLFQKIFKT